MAHYLVFILALSAGMSFSALTTFQQINFLYDRYWYVVPTSISIAASQGCLIVLFVQQGFFIVTVGAGVGMSLGVFGAMYHDKRTRQ